MNKKDLEKKRVLSRIASFNISEEPYAEPMMVLISKALEEAKETYTDIMFSIQACEDGYGDGNLIILEGYRLEDEEEWHQRVASLKYGLERSLENLQNVAAREKKIQNDIIKLDEILKASPLKCVDCGDPCAYITNAYKSNGEFIRVCSKCSDIRKSKAISKKS